MNLACGWVQDQEILSWHDRSLPNLLTYATAVTIQLGYSCFLPSQLLYYRHSVTTMLQNLSRPTLQYRRKRMCLSLLYKSINHLTALKIPNYFTPIYASTRIHHQRSYNFANIRTDSYMNSYFPRTIREWNALPLNIIESSSLNLFQHQLDLISINH